ncbi:MAG: rod shape-determining protein MreD [Micavibrio aeruginosavorus]|uniref:Rod shape-determining protein MreD n=1 Tax=Micavibrio aeruginosavorus TaxID=349221 RepID=A0A2W5N5B5_9BACT|nr:MAG: rod shape-determining protein MreD [Micavibrio aeruginosavorus]
MSQFLPYDFVTWAMRLLLAQGVILLFLLLNVVSFSMPHAGDFKPFFLLMAVYYWAIYRPTVMPVAYTFILGLIMDLLMNIPAGLSSLLFVGLQTIVRRSRLFLMGQPYIMVWLGFAIMSVVYTLSFWFLMSLRDFHFLPLASLLQMLVAALLSVLLFPLASLVLQAVHRVLPVTANPMRVVG